MKTTAATGIAGAGLVGASGSAAALHEFNIDADNFVSGNSLVSVVLQDLVDVGDITLEDITVNILSNGVEILSDIRIRDVIDINDNTVVITIQNVLNRILQQVNVSNVTVQVCVLGVCATDQSQLISQRLRQ